MPNAGLRQNTEIVKEIKRDRILLDLKPLAWDDGKKDGGTEMPRKFMDKRFEASLKKLQNILKGEREHQGISRAEVAKRMGISQPYLSQLESENRHLYWRLFLSWCQALKVPPQSIIERWQRLLRIFSNP